MTSFRTGHIKLRINHNGKHYVCSYQSIFAMRSMVLVLSLCSQTAFQTTWRFQATAFVICILPKRAGFQKKTFENGSSRAVFYFRSKAAQVLYHRDWGVRTAYLCTAATWHDGCKCGDMMQMWIVTKKSRRWVDAQIRAGNKFKCANYHISDLSKKFIFRTTHNKRVFTPAHFPTIPFPHSDFPTR